MMHTARSRRPSRFLVVPVLATLMTLPPAAMARAADDREAPQAVAREAGDPRLADLEQRVRELEAALSAARRDDADAPSVAELERRLEVLSREIESLRIGEAAVEADEGVYGFGPAASKVYRSGKGVSIGGYGEGLYESFDSEKDDGTGSGKTDRADFLRAVLYVGYKFSDRILFNSEIEFEHASTGKDGEVSVELAYLDFLLHEKINARAGLLLVPMGFVNELHEPPIFLGARRPDLERRLIPTTWRENGAGVFGDLGPVSYRAYLVAGLDGAGLDESGFSASGIRGARQSGSESIAEDFALVARADWQVIPGLSLGGSFYTGDSGQGAVAPSSGRRIGARTDILDLHLEWRWRGVEFRGLWVDLSIDDAELINDYQCILPLDDVTGQACPSGDAGQSAAARSQSVAEEMSGYYLQAGYDLLSTRDTRQALIPFVRYETFNTQDRVPDGFLADPANDVEILTYGVNYRPIPSVVLKLDYQDFENGAGTGVDQWNVAVGFLF